MPIYFGEGQSNSFVYKGIEGGVIARKEEKYWFGVAAIYIPGKGILLNSDVGETEEEAIENAKKGVINRIDELKQE